MRWLATASGPAGVAVLLLIGAALFAAGVAEALLGGLGLDALDRSAQSTVREVTLRAGAAFAISKTINAALSFAQEISISANVLVAGGSFHPARFLEPVNNLVDQFAFVMLVVAASAAALEVLLAVGAGVGGAVLLPAGLLVLAAGLFLRSRGYRASDRLARLGGLVLLIALVVRLALPVALALTGAISDRYLHERYATASSNLQIVEGRAEAAASEARRLEEAADDPGFLERQRENAAAVRRALALVGENFDSLFDDVVTLVTVFLLETLVLPLLLAWATYRGLRLLGEAIASAWPVRRLPASPRGGTSARR
jgi:hypothetical protein